jgi:hypothetical protein
MGEDELAAWNRIRQGKKTDKYARVVMQVR